MGDIVGLVRDFEEVVDVGEAEKDAERILRGQFTLDDLVTQLRTIQKLGPLREVFAKLPFFGGMADQVEEGELTRVQALIGSMTRQERREPDVIDKSRAERIARGSGRRAKEVYELVKRFGQMRDLMGQLGGGGGLLSRVPGLGRLAGAGAGGLDPSALFGGPAAPGPRGARGDAARRKKRKAARKARRKGRRR
jgi:signal recognition particle subunit SRP54